MTTRRTFIGTLLGAVAAMVGCRRTACPPEPLNTPQLGAGHAAGVQHWQPRSCDIELHGIAGPRALRAAVEHVKLLEETLRDGGSYTDAGYFVPLYPYERVVILRRLELLRTPWPIRVKPRPVSYAPPPEQDNLSCTPYSTGLRQQWQQCVLKPARKLLGIDRT